MDSVLAGRVQLPRLSRFGWLMGLYAENHARLQRLFEPGDLACGEYASAIGDGLDLRLHVVERHAYTVELQMSYGLVDPQTGLLPLGDMAISLERARDQAKRFGNSLRRETGYLTIHSILHLLGYDHMDEGEMKRQMRTREEIIAGQLGLQR